MDPGQMEFYHHHDGLAAYTNTTLTGFTSEHNVVSFGELAKTF